MITEIDIKDAAPIWYDTIYCEPCDIMAIQQGGCASGAYMPAVTYHEAAETMAEHGDAVLDYIKEVLGELPNPHQAPSWSGLAAFYLANAVELWASQFDWDELVEGDNEAFQTLNQKETTK